MGAQQSRGVRPSRRVEVTGRRADLWGRADELPCGYQRPLGDAQTHVPVLSVPVLGHGRPDEGEGVDGLEVGCV
eukprot:scaffold17336_cov58-Phaeocystis_antarctica.AAC.5